MSEIPQFVGLKFPVFQYWVKAHWVPGKHGAFVGPTGEGKSTLAVHLLRMRKYVMALDPKGEDTTLERSGFTRITSFPLPRKIRRDLAEERPVRIIIGGPARSHADDRRNKALIQSYVEWARFTGGWTVYADEFQVLSDMRMFGLGVEIERQLITARKDASSILTSFQAAAWVSKAATRQATAFIVIFRTRDEDMIKAAAKAAGRPFRDVITAIEQLPPFHCLVIPADISAPMLIINPPELTSG